MKVTYGMLLLKSLPGVGEILAIVIEREVGFVGRFFSHESFAGYSGTVAKVSGSWGKVKHGKMRKDVNQYLK